MTVVVTAVFHPVEGRSAELVAALQASIPAVQAEDGCMPSMTPRTAPSR